MTRAELRQLMRWRLDEIGTGYLADTDASNYDANQAITDAYDRWARDTKCFPVGYTLAATIGTANYAYSAFGTGTPKAGARMFEIGHVEFNNQPLLRQTVGQLDQYNPLWRSQGNSTPRFWVPWGDSQFKLVPTPGATSNIYVEGWETAVTTDFDGDTESPAISLIDQPMIALGGAIILVSRHFDRDLAAWLQVWKSEYDDGVRNAVKRIHGSGDEEIVLGRFAQVQQFDSINYDAATGVVPL